MIASPCIDLCTLDPAGRHCLGCLRTPGEIAAWPQLGNEQRARVIGALPERHRLLEGRESGLAPKHCARCGTAFGCGADDPARGCWCQRYPPVTPAAGPGCLCPGCLAQAVRDAKPAPG